MRSASGVSTSTAATLFNGDNDDGSDYIPSPPDSRAGSDLEDEEGAREPGSEQDEEGDEADEEAQRILQEEMDAATAQRPRDGQEMIIDLADLKEATDDRWAELASTRARVDWSKAMIDPTDVEIQPYRHFQDSIVVLGNSLGLGAIIPSGRSINHDLEIQPSLHTFAYKEKHFPFKHSIDSRMFRLGTSLHRSVFLVFVPTSPDIADFNTSKSILQPWHRYLLIRFLKKCLIDIGWGGLTTAIGEPTQFLTTKGDDLNDYL